MTAGLTKRHHTFVQVAFPERELIFISRYSDFILIKYKWSVVKQNCESFVERGLSYSLLLSQGLQGQPQGRHSKNLYE